MQFFLLFESSLLKTNTVTGCFRKLLSFFIFRKWNDTCEVFLRFKSSAETNGLGNERHRRGREIMIEHDRFGVFVAVTKRRITQDLSLNWLQFCVDKDKKPKCEICCWLCPAHSIWWHEEVCDIIQQDCTNNENRWESLEQPANTFLLGLCELNHFTVSWK